MRMITPIDYSFIILQMHSVSIVYRKDRRESLANPNAQHHYKRSVDQYYTRLMQKEKHIDRINSQKKQILDKIRLRTSSNQRKADKHNILQTLNIVPLALHQQQTGQQKKEEIKALQKMYVSRKLEISRPLLKGMSFVPLTQHYQQQQILQNKYHSKLKCLFKQRQNNDVKDTVIALSVNFILDQHYFWQEEMIDEGASRFWKKLQLYANIVWICQKQESLKKLIKYSKANDCRLDGVYLIQQRKNKNMLTVAYNTIQNDFGIKFHRSNSPLLSKQQTKLIVVNGLVIESLNNLNYSSFYCSVPIIKNCRTIVHYNRIDLYDKMRFGSVMKILSQEERPQPFDLMKIIVQYEKKEANNQATDWQEDYDEFQTSNIDLLAKIEDTKKDFIKYFSQSLSVNLNQKITFENSENSGLFLIGDLLRRNYKIYQQYNKFANSYRLHNQHKRAKQSQQKSKRSAKVKHNFNLKKYRNEVYLWDF